MFALRPKDGVFPTMKQVEGVENPSEVRAATVCVLASVLFLSSSVARRFIVSPALSIVPMHHPVQS